MQLKSVEKKEKSTSEIILDITHEEFDSAITEAYRKNKNSISVPGFRKGKAPRKIVETVYGSTVFHAEAMDAIMPQALSFISEEATMKIVSMPKVSDYTIKDEGGLEITFLAAIYPEVTIGEYKGLAAYKPEVEVNDNLIESELAAVRLRNARIMTAERPAINGDIAVIDYEGFIDGEPFEGGKSENYELELGSNTFIPGFEQKIQGMVSGEKRDIDLVFPEDYTEQLAGKPVVFKITLNEIKEKILPELDDEFAKDVSEFDTLEEYKADIKDKLVKDRQTAADAEFENVLLDQLEKLMEADVPDDMIEDHMNSTLSNLERQIAAYGMTPESYLQMMQTTPEDFRANMLVSAEKQVRTILALEKIAEIENIEISDEDVETEFKEAAERYGAEIEELKKSADREALISDLKVRRAAKIVTENATALAEKPVIESDDQENETSDMPVDQLDEKSKNEAVATETVEDKSKETQDEQKADTKTAAKKPTVRKTAARKQPSDTTTSDGEEKPVKKTTAKTAKKESSKNEASDS